MSHCFLSHLRDRYGLWTDIHDKTNTHDKYQCMSMLLWLPDTMKKMRMRDAEEPLTNNKNPTPNRVNIFMLIHWMPPPSDVIIVRKE